MKFVNRNAEIYVPDGIDKEDALARTSCLAIVAHPDDMEIAAYHGIAECFGNKDRWFSGIVMTNGAGSPRISIYADYTDEEMQETRKKEQKKAAVIGEYSAIVLLDHTSSKVKSKSSELVLELSKLIEISKPEVIYTHNLADKHDTHVGVALKTISAIRLLQAEIRPKKLFGCEVWRSLDWVNDEEKVMLDVSKHPNIAAAAVEIFDSQIIGGKRYDKATLGRRMANATYAASHGADESEALSFAMDLTPLIIDDDLDIKEYILRYIDNFRIDVANRLDRAGY